MKILLPILLTLLTQQAFSSGYKDAYDEIYDTPGYLKGITCYKYHFITGNIPNAGRASTMSKQIAERYLSARGYSDTDIEIALFANDAVLKTQIDEIIMGIGFKVPLASRRLANMKKVCAGGR